MYKKFLSMTLLVSMVHVLSANEQQASDIDNIEIVETAISTNLEVVTENTQSTTDVEAAESSVEAQENQAVFADTTESVSQVPTTDNNVEVVEATETVVEVVPVTVEPTINEVAYDFMVAPEAAELLKGLSAEAQEDFENFGIALGKDILAMPEVQAFYDKHLVISSEYKDFKGENPKISVDFFMSGEQVMNEITSKIDETNFRFNATLSEENKIKFANCRQELQSLLGMILGFTLSQIRTRKFPSELIRLDQNQELLVNIRLD